MPFHRLAEEPPIVRSPEASFTTRSPLLPADFLVDSTGVAHRGGFRFRLARGPEGSFVGCWAWPNLRGFSGQNTYWADFSSGEIRQMRRPPTASKALEAPPATADLAPEVRLRF